MPTVNPRALILQMCQHQMPTYICSALLLIRSANPCPSSPLFLIPLPDGTWRHCGRNRAIECLAASSQPPPPPAPNEGQELQTGVLYGALGGGATHNVVYVASLWAGGLGVWGGGGPFWLGGFGPKPPPPSPRHTAHGGARS